MKNFFIFIVVLCFVYPVKGQNYPVNAIPEDLKKEAQAVVRESTECFTQQDEYTGNYKVKYVITILNEKGKFFSDWAISEGDFTELKNFSGEVFDATGKSIKKIGKKDLTTMAWSSNLATNDKKTFCQYRAPFYPYTIKYEYEMKFKNGILFYPSFNPISNYRVALESAEYILQVPTGQTVRYKNQGTDIQPEKYAVFNSYIWKLNQIAAIPYEDHAPEDLFPVVYVAPEKFCVEKACGSMATWATYGQWEAELLKGRSTLPQSTKEKVLELTKNVSGKREKAKLLYEYMQKNTHYVSIQLGIGGWQPMKAEEVAQTGFGDCKALTNYMQSLLSVVDIPSYYLVISSQKKRFFPDFPSFSQANHVIVMLPLENDTVFLECTSQDFPFGYVSRLEGHDALAIGADQSFFYTLPEDRPKENAEINRVHIQLDQQGNGHLEVHSLLKNREFERLFYALKGADAKEENDALAALLQVHKPKISNIRKNEILEQRPQLDVRFTVDCEDFANQTGSRLLIPINPARTSLKGLLSGSSRKYDIVIQSDKYQIDTISIQIPEGYIVEAKPKSLEFESEYGSFKSEIMEENGVLTYIQVFEIKRGKYPASAFEEMKKFYNRIETLQNSKVGFIKQ